MNLMEKSIRTFYWLIILVLFAILIYSSVELIVLIGRSMANKVSIFDFSDPTIDTKNLFLQHVQGFIAGILLLTIILELIQSLYVYLRSQEHAKYLVVLYEIAMIAVVRHLFTLDFEHLDGPTILGLSFLVLVLGILNFFNKPSIINRFTQTNKK